MVKTLIVPPITELKTLQDETTLHKQLRYSKIINPTTMRVMFLALTTMLFLIVSNAQTVIWLKDDDAVAKMTKLDLLHADAGHSDPDKGLFEPEELFPAWQAFIGEFNQLLQSSGLEWENELRVWVRFYFDKDGNLEYSIYRLLGENILGEFGREKYHSISEKIIADQKIKFPLQADRPFAQCGSAILRMNEKADE